MTKEEFRSWRRRMGLTQIQAAKRLGCHVRTIENYERYGNITRIVALACAALEAGIDV